MSDWNYTKCAKPFATREEAREFMLKRGFDGHILARDNGCFTAVCPTYPEGYYPDAVLVETVGQSMPPTLPLVHSNDACCSSSVQDQRPARRRTLE